MGYLVEKAVKANGNGYSKLEHVAWAALGASGMAGVMASASLIAWIVTVVK
jgi:hypothetical protein